jgi:hypothetical protein
MTPAIVRIGERSKRVQAGLLQAGLLQAWLVGFAAWVRGNKARFADLHALRRGTLPAPKRAVSWQRQLAVIVGVASGSACIAGYGLAVIATAWSHADATGGVGTQASAASRAAEGGVAPADLTFDVARLISSHEAPIERLMAERTQAFFDRDRAAAERDAVLTEHDAAQAAERDSAQAQRDAALAADREMLLDLHARTSRTIAEIESILAATGIDSARVESGRVLKTSGSQNRGRPRGGPFVPWTDRAARESGSDSARRLASLT